MPMKCGLIVKFAVLLLTAVSLVAAVGGAAGIIALESSGLYVNDLDTLQDAEYKSISGAISESYAERYTVETMSNLSYRLREELYPDPENRGDAEYWTVRIRQGAEILVDPGDTGDYSVVKSYTVAPLYPVFSPYPPHQESEDTVSVGTTDATGVTEPTQEPSTEPAEPEEEIPVPEGYLYYERDTRWEGASLTSYYLYYYQAPEYEVTVYMMPQVLENSALHLLTDMFPFRYEFIAILALGVVLFAAGLAYLCWSAGRNADGTLAPGGLNLLPLDLYACAAVAAIWLLWQVFREVLSFISSEGPHLGNLSLAGVNLVVMVIIGLAFLCALAAQIKPSGYFWWNHSAVGWCLTRLWRLLKFLWRGIRSLVSLIPVVWQWVLTAGMMVLSLLIGFLWAGSSQEGIWALLAAILACGGIVAYSAYAFGALMRGIRRMNEGDLSHQIPTKYLWGNFLTFAVELNSLSETAMIAAEHEMRSERMKSELITNVSHDIKTPLTSIINFVDLLRKPHSPEESQAYLDVLSRQSARMKKLIEDLMELSKANSGNTPVTITRIDAVETVNQALGEFSDKLESARLEPVFRHGDAPIIIRADGRLSWRVLSNLLSNAVKYAMPDTRLYLDLIQVEDTVLLSLKNISRKALTVSADELLERFVRGDSSRKSEGSGLGLNIAKSLMELQGGSLQLLLDGDLFKVTLRFPRDEG